MNTLEAVNAAQTLTQRLPATLSETAKRLYTVLVAAGIETARGRGQSSKVTEVVMHCPLEQVAVSAGFHRVTVWRHLPALRALGLLDYRAHKGTLRGETRNTGSVWVVRLSPVRGRKARLSYQDLKHRWRDLDKDVRAGRTSWAQIKRLQHTNKPSRDSLDISNITDWTLTPKTTETPLRMYVARELECVQDVISAAFSARGEAVDSGARALASALGDAGSLGWYRRLLWQLLRRFDATGEDYSYQVYLMALRARTDRSEGFARRAGALFVSRLKQASWFSEMIGAPPVRVGTPPAK